MPSSGEEFGICREARGRVHFSGMATGLKILALEPYFGGVQAALLDGLRQPRAEDLRGRVNGE